MRFGHSFQRVRALPFERVLAVQVAVAILPDDSWARLDPNQRGCQIPVSPHGLARPVN
jgi:hypothetical protein